MHYYTYDTLDPRRAPAAEAHNDHVLAAPVLGVEVTVPALAERCTLGNMDPQHLGGDASRCAMDEALTWPLPPTDSILATVRPDADSIGAMAVLALRKEAGMDGSGEDLWDMPYRLRTTGYLVQGGTGMMERGKLVAAADKEASGPWPGPRPIDSAHNLLRPTTAVEAMCADHRLTMTERVTRMRDWLLSGDFTGQAGYQARAEAEAEQALASLDARVCDGAAVVVGAHRLAMSIGYRLAPVVVATNPAFSWQGGPAHVKHTIARWNTVAVDMDWAGVLVALQSREAGWGGSSSIVGSPQGIGSDLTTGEVVQIVTKNGKRK